jgi:hypothetical protein
MAGRTQILRVPDSLAFGNLGSLGAGSLDDQGARFYCSDTSVLDSSTMVEILGLFLALA